MPRGKGSGKSGKGKAAAQLALALQMKAAAAAPRTTLSSKAGLVFPVGRIRRKLKESAATRQRISAGSAVYLTAVLEYMIAEIVELGGNVATDFKKARIVPRHIFLAVGNDAELLRLFPPQSTIIAEGGVVPHIHEQLLPKRNLVDY